MLLPLLNNTWRSRWRRGRDLGRYVLELLAIQRLREEEEPVEEVLEAIREAVISERPKSIHYTLPLYTPVSYIPAVQISYDRLASLAAENARISRLLEAYYRRVAREFEDEEDAIALLLA